jgi:hypothetical protein
MTWLYLAAKPSHVGVDVDGLAYTQHCPMAYIRQTSEQASYHALSCPVRLLWAVVPFQGM